MLGRGASGAPQRPQTGGRALSQRRGSELTPPASPGGWEGADAPDPPLGGSPTTRDGAPFVCSLSPTSLGLPEAWPCRPSLGLVAWRVLQPGPGSVGSLCPPGLGMHHSGWGEPALQTGVPSKRLLRARRDAGGGWRAWQACPTELQPPPGPGRPPPPAAEVGKLERACQDRLRVTQPRSGPLFADREPEAGPGVYPGRGGSESPQPNRGPAPVHPGGLPVPSLPG